MDCSEKDKLLMCLKSVYQEVNCHNYESDEHRVVAFRKICKMLDNLEDSINVNTFGYLNDTCQLS